MKKEIELLWASEKYTVMAKGYNFYKDIQGNMREAQSEEDYIEIRDLIAEYKLKLYDKKALINTSEHIWGYFKKEAEEAEKKHFFSLLDELKRVEDEQFDEIPYEIQLYLHFLLQKYPSDYLKRSTFIK
ncbi:DUF1722 domain-containing protein [Fictibacillus phosphorivorans]|uniref:DUF1722 domain-containing protein n=1 Tax=Fictibacillus phosphorivorans TaxID=1221500 RepID=UPI002041F23C|nr:DUF1722 domain-containing protein [Fictibacillus phosphorivorans]MCM3718367.1 YbgA family protein [Fictibacillus phosphorivorans]MCM3775991.1 YbgA family protein [Fictibacillus phosphorivorans]